MMAGDDEFPERHWSKEESDQFRRGRRGRNLALLAVLGALALLFYAISMVRLKGGG